MIRGVSRRLRRVSETENPVVLRADERLEIRVHFTAEAFPVHEDAESDTFGQPSVPSSVEFLSGHVCSVHESNPECLEPDCGVHELAEAFTKPRVRGKPGWESELTGLAVQGKMILVPALARGRRQGTLPLGVTGNTPDSSGT